MRKDGVTSQEKYLVHRVRSEITVAYKGIHPFNMTWRSDSTWVIIIIIIIITVFYSYLIDIIVLGK